MAKPAVNPGDNARKVLIIKLGPLGEFVLSMGGIKTVRDHHPSAQITLLTTPPFEKFAKACPWLDRVETDGRPEDTKSTAKMIRRLRSEKYDMVYDFQTSTRSSGYFQAMRPRPPLWSGTAPGAAFSFPGSARDELHPLERIGIQLSAAGIGPARGYPIGEPKIDFDWIKPALHNPPRLQPAFFSLHGPYALLLPGVPAGQIEFWPETRFAELAKWVADQGITPVIIGGKSESAIGNAVVRAEPRAKTLCTRTDIFQIISLGMEAQFAVGQATGPMHSVTLAGCPGVTLAPTKRPFELLTPRGSNVLTLQAPELDAISVSDIAQAVKVLGALSQP